MSEELDTALARSAALQGTYNAQRAVSVEAPITHAEFALWREWMRLHPPVPEKVAKVKTRKETAWTQPQQWNDPRSKL